MRIVVLFGISMLLIYCSCNGFNAVDEYKAFVNSKESQLIQDIPEDMFNHRKSFLDLKTKIIGIQSIDSGFNEFQVRIWEEFEDLTGRLIIIKNTGKWDAQLYNFKYISRGFEYDSLVAKQIILNTPKIGWPKFIDRLFEYKVTDCIDYSYIPKYSVDSDAQFVTIEVAKENFYKVCQHPNVYRMKTRITEAKQMAEMLDYISFQFSLK